ncbi:DUF1275 domain protein [Dipodascopsis uninucleata]
MASAPIHDEKPYYASWRRHLTREAILAYLTEDVGISVFLESQLILLGFATGVHDAITYPYYQCFMSNQTGNTIFLGIGIANIDRDKFNLSNCGLSLGMFVAGALTLGQLGNVAGTRRRIWLIFSSLIQTALGFASAAIQASFEDLNQRTLRFAVIAMLSFASGGQVGLARGVKISEIPTAVVTSAYVDFLIDPKLISLHNRSRNRRFFFVLALFVGGLSGAFAYKQHSPAFAFFISAICRFIVMVMFFFTPKLKD